jgi:hypothetical protein
LIDRRQHSNVLDARSFREADVDTDRYLVVAEDRERLAVSKQKMQSEYEVVQSQETKRGIELSTISL